ncbi:uncharacterized protein [Saccopteryx bilineata]|uniref:uncharacterized protein isoform X2 n=1 Tax=Saccopteryx bilineata TaxID=59482 RepID=UPI00338FD8A0
MELMLGHLPEGATLRCGHKGTFRPEGRGTGVGARPELPHHKGQDLQSLSQLPKGAQQCPATVHCRLPSSKETRESHDSRGLGAFLPALLARLTVPESQDQPGPTRVRAEDDRPVSRSRSPPCRPPISPFLAEAPPAPNGKALLPAQREMRLGQQDWLGAPPTAPSTGARPGQWPPALALARPSRGSSGSPAGAGLGMRTAASLPVKVSPGPNCKTRWRGEATRGGGERQQGDLTPSLREERWSPGMVPELVSHPPFFCLLWQAVVGTLLRGRRRRGRKRENGRRRREERREAGKGSARKAGEEQRKGD